MWGGTITHSAGSHFHDAKLCFGHVISDFEPSKPNPNLFLCTCKLVDLFLKLSALLDLFYFMPQSQEAQVLKQLAEKREHEREVLQKAVEENNNFSKMAEEKLILKMEQIKENREANLAALIERLQEKVTRLQLLSYWGHRCVWYSGVPCSSKMHETGDWLLKKILEDIHLIFPFYIVFSRRGMLQRSAETRSSRKNCLAESIREEDGITSHPSPSSPVYITDHEILVWEMYDMVLKKKTNQELNKNRTKNKNNAVCRMICLMFKNTTWILFCKYLHFC